MSDMFSLTKITKILIGRGITGIGDHAFEGCLSVSAVNISDTVTYIGEKAFFANINTLYIDTLIIGNPQYIVNNFCKVI